MPTTNPDAVTTRGDGGSPGVLLLHPWWGVTPAMRWWADQLVSVGRRVVVPDLYGGARRGDVARCRSLVVGPAVRRRARRRGRTLGGDGLLDGRLPGMRPGPS